MGPVELRHDEVHAEPAGDELQGQEDHGDDSQGLHRVVLDEVDLGLVGLTDLLEVLLVTEDEVVQTVEFLIDEDEFRFHVGELVGQEFHLFVIPFFLGDLPAEFHDGVDAVLVGDRFFREEFVFERFDLVLEPRELVDVRRGQGEEEREEFVEPGLVVDAFGLFDESGRAGHHAAALVVREEHRAVFVDGVEGHEEGAVVGADDVVAGTADFPLRGHIDVLVEVFGLVRRKDLDHGVLLLPQSF